MSGGTSVNYQPVTLHAFGGQKVIITVSEQDDHFKPFVASATIKVDNFYRNFTYGGTTAPRAVRALVALIRLEEARAIYKEAASEARDMSVLDKPTAK